MVTFSGQRANLFLLCVSKSYRIFMESPLVNLPSTTHLLKLANSPPSNRLFLMGKELPCLGETNQDLSLSYLTKE